MFCQFCNSIIPDNSKFCNMCGRILTSNQQIGNTVNSFREQFKKEAFITKEEMLAQCYAEIDREIEHFVNCRLESVKNSMMEKYRDGNYQYSNGAKVITDTFNIGHYMSGAFWNIEKKEYLQIAFPDGSEISWSYDGGVEGDDKYHWGSDLVMIQENASQRTFILTKFGLRAINIISSKLRENGINVYDTFIRVTISTAITTGNFFTGKSTQVKNWEMHLHNGEGVVLRSIDRGCTCDVCLAYTFSF